MERNNLCLLLVQSSINLSVCLTHYTVFCFHLFYLLKGQDEFGKRCLKLHFDRSNAERGNKVRIKGA